MSAPRRWLRLDVTWSASNWITLLEPGGRLAWIELLGYVKAIGAAGRAKAMGSIAASRRWDIPITDVDAMLEAAQADSALQLSEGDWIVTGWARYQEVDTTATERQRRYRAEKSRLSPLRQDERDIDRNGCNEPVTPPVTRRVTETLTLTETLTVTEPKTERQLPVATGVVAEADPDPVGQAVGQADAYALEAHPLVAEKLAVLVHGGGFRASAELVAERYLPPDDGNPAAEESVRGLPLAARELLVLEALAEYRASGEVFKPRLFAGFVRRLRDQGGRVLPPSSSSNGAPMIVTDREGNRIDPATGDVLDAVAPDAAEGPPGEVNPADVRALVAGVASALKSQPVPEPRRRVKR